MAVTRLIYAALNGFRDTTSSRGCLPVADGLVATLNYECQ